jgi:hypothetical protein
MADILQSMGIAGAILLGVVGLVVLMSFAAVKRGEMTMHGEHDVKAWWNAGLSKSGHSVAAAPMTSADISVMQILLVGTGMFVVAVLLLFLVSVVGHL